MIRCEGVKPLSYSEMSEINGGYEPIRTLVSFLRGVWDGFTGKKPAIELKNNKK